MVRDSFVETVRSGHRRLKQADRPMDTVAVPVAVLMVLLGWSLFATVVVGIVLINGVREGVMTIVRGDREVTHQQEDSGNET